MSKIETLSIIPIKYLDSSVGSCSKVNHDRYHNGDGTQVADSERQGESTATVAPEVIGQQYSEFLRSFGVLAGDAARNARYLCDPKALAERSKTEKTIDTKEPDAPDGNGSLINGQSMLARQVEMAKSMALQMAQTTVSRPAETKLSPVAQNTASQPSVVFRRK